MSTLRVGAPAPNLELLGAGDHRVQMAERWHEGPTILVFLRHFG